MDGHHALPGNGPVPGPVRPRRCADDGALLPGRARGDMAFQVPGHGRRRVPLQLSPGWVLAFLPARGGSRGAVLFDRGLVRFEACAGTLLLQGGCAGHVGKSSAGDEPVVLRICLVGDESCVFVLSLFLPVVCHAQLVRETPVRRCFGPSWTQRGLDRIGSCAQRSHHHCVPPVRGSQPA